VLEAHPAPKLIAAVHAETSTGVRSDLRPLAEGKGEALLLADCDLSLADDKRVSPHNDVLADRRPELYGPVAERPIRASSPSSPSPSRSPTIASA
jgi:hypothetical protein